MLYLFQIMELEKKLINQNNLTEDHSHRFESNLASVVPGERKHQVREGERDTQCSYYNSQTILRDELERVFEARKKQVNGRYSLSRFAHDLGIPKSSLSEFFNGKLAFKKRVVARRIKPFISEAVYELFLKEHDFEKKIDFEEFSRPENTINLYSVDEDGIPYLNEKQERFTEDPYCFIFLVAFDLEDFEPSVAWFVRKFGLSEAETQEKLELLLDLRLLERHGDFYRSMGARPRTIKKKFNHTGPKFIETINRVNQRFLDSEKQSFSGESRNYSYFEWFFSPLNPSDVDQFKKELSALTRKFHQKQLSSKPKRVYCFKLDFFPVDTE